MTPAQQIIEQTEYRGVDASIDAVGFEAKGSTLETVLATIKVETSDNKDEDCRKVVLTPW